MSATWARVNRNSLAQFMRTRTRYLWISKRLVWVPHPIAGVQLVVSGERGQTYMWERSDEQA